MYSDIAFAENIDFTMFSIVGIDMRRNDVFGV